MYQAFGQESILVNTLANETQKTNHSKVSNTYGFAETTPEAASTVVLAWKAPFCVNQLRFYILKFYV